MTDPSKKLSFFTYYVKTNTFHMALNIHYSTHRSFNEDACAPNLTHEAFVRLFVTPCAHPPSIAPYIVHTISLKST